MNKEKPNTSVTDSSLYLGNEKAQKLGNVDTGSLYSLYVNVKNSVA